MSEHGSLVKPSRTARKLEQRKSKRDRRTAEDDNKRAVRARDLHRCRFPLCGCKKLGLRLEVSHDTHKGMGGNPKGDRSTPSGMILFCLHRHQDGRISRHRGTLRTVPLSAAGNNGPLAFEVDAAIVASILPAGVKDLIVPINAAIRGNDYWLEVARERKIQVLEPLEPWQERILGMLAEMEA